MQRIYGRLGSIDSPNTSVMVWCVELGVKWRGKNFDGLYRVIGGPDDFLGLRHVVSAGISLLLREMFHVGLRRDKLGVGLTETSHGVSRVRVCIDCLEGSLKSLLSLNKVGGAVKETSRGSLWSESSHHLTEFWEFNLARLVGIGVFEEATDLLVGHVLSEKWDGRFELLSVDDTIGTGEKVECWEHLIVVVGEEG